VAGKGYFGLRLLRFARNDSIETMSDSQENMTVGHVGIGADIAFAKALQATF